MKAHEEIDMAEQEEKQSLLRTPGGASTNADGVSQSNQSSVLLIDEHPHEGTASGSPVDVDKYSIVGTARRRTSSELIAFTMFNFPFGAVLGCSVTLLSLESEKLAPENSSLMLGLFCIMAGLAQLVCPPLGKLSDRCRSVYGKRRPYMTMFTFPTIFAFFLMWHCSLEKNLVGYVLSLLLMMICISAAQTASLGIIADLVSPEQRGEASGYSGASWLFGALAGNFCLQSVAYVDFRLLYGVMAATLFMSWLVMMGIVAERDTSKDPEVKNRGAKLWEEFLDCFTLDTSQGYDFAFVVLGRTFYYCSVSSQAFIFFYIRDFLTADRHRITYNLAGVAIISYCIAVIGASTGGALSDRPGYGRKRMVYLSCIVMCVSCGMLLLFPYVVNGNFALPKTVEFRQFPKMALDPEEERTEFLIPSGDSDDDGPAGVKTLNFQTLAHFVSDKLHFEKLKQSVLNFLHSIEDPSQRELRGWGYIFATAMVYALGNGAFSAVDYALALDTLPNKNAATQNLGFWSISHFIGFAVGPAVYGVLLRGTAQFSTSVEANDPANFAYTGYALVYFTAMLFQLICALLVFKVKGST
ncbi:unnamed protein product [Amoebophrya sp. A120]|nr:unnamed protein product [Amoebophrya sp. A120]|eukprot:GSA120T00012969001.1